MMRRISMVLALWLAVVGPSMAIVNMKRADLKLDNTGVMILNSRTAAENINSARPLAKGITGTWAFGGDIASAGDQVLLDVKEVQSFNGFNLFTYDLYVNGYLNDEGLVGIKKSNVMVFNISYVDGFSTVYAKVNEAGNRASYAEMFVNDRYCEYLSDGYYTCQFYTSGVTAVNTGAMGK